ncbi:citrate/2-methylcitrate synthase [Ruegeria arenilitoris]|uniref:citrate/2-methylcitrate synthase n=1 Tax=Ruegeria arenilitoris TaxID=1173585 RepID=UPI003F5D4476
MLNRRAKPTKPLKAGAIVCGCISGIYFKTLEKYDAIEVMACARLAPQIEGYLSDIKSRAIPMNIDGATAAVYVELGFKASLASGLFCLSRSVGILAHAWEQTQQGGRNKGPLPKDRLWTYLTPSEK